VTQVGLVHEREHSYSTNVRVGDIQIVKSQMGFWHQEVCREKELISRKGKILFLYQEVKRPESLSHSFGGHSPSNSVCPESNRVSSLINLCYPQSSLPQKQVLTVQLIIQTGKMTSFLIPPLIYFILTSSLSARTVNSASKIYPHPAISLHLRHCVKARHPHLQPPLLQPPPYWLSCSLPLAPHNPGQQPRGMLNKWTANNITSLLKTSHSVTSQPHQIRHVSLTRLTRPGPCPPH